MQAPVIIKPIPPQIINELAAFGPFSLMDFIADDEQSDLRFSAETSDGLALPKGMICTENGIITGIPAKETEGHYEVIITAQNDAGSVQTTFAMTIKPSAAASGAAYADKVKSQVWEALKDNLPLPDLAELYDRPVTAADVYHLVERCAFLAIYDAFNLDSPGDKKLLTLEGANKYFNFYDRGSCLVVAPKDLFSHERTLGDALDAARTLAREAFSRGWTLEVIGFDKMSRAAWVELQHLADRHCRPVEVVNYNPTPDDVKLYSIQAESIRSGNRLD